MLLQVIAITALGCYIISAVLFLLSILLRSPEMHSVGSYTLGLGFAVHCLDLILLMIGFSQTLTFDRGDYFFWLSFILVLVYFVLGRRTNFSMIGVLVAIIAALFLAGSGFTATEGTGLRGDRSGSIFFIVHVIPAMLAQVALLFSLIVSVAFLITESRIKAKLFSVVAPRSPSLELLENLQLWFIGSGFGLITLAIMTGAVWKISHLLPLFPKDFAEWSAVLCWSLLAFLLYARSHLNYSPKKLSKTVVVGSGLFFIALFVVALSGSSVLHVIE